jgi:hypothetical protein
MKTGASLVAGNTVRFLLAKILDGTVPGVLPPQSEAIWNSAT